ncbi:thiolase domain-containing protein [Candidatus Bathyarchaeota archaeon]|nr:thiolase domain-containing protein [Candidatus Bathyarchaeota archaeon]MBS7630467.1 thiolase domain-containing protein [Candidatus Bathyarchaeota archaeon]
MRRVAVAGIGLTPISEHWDKSLVDLAVESSCRAIDDSGSLNFDTLYVANVGSAFIQRQQNLGSMISDALGIKGINSLSIEASSASGGFAFNEAVRAVASGVSDSVLVIGVEKMSDALPEEVASTLAMSEDQEYIAYTGITNFGLNALIHRFYMECYGVTASDIAMFAVRCHEHAEGCNHAQYPFKISVDRVLTSPMESDPIHALECSGIGDGAAAVILKPFEGKDREVEVLATATSTDIFHLTQRRDITTLNAVCSAAEKAFRTAGISRKEVDLLELHDDSTIMGVLSLEDLGFAEKGKGSTLVVSGVTSRTGELPTNTFGGLKARGNPIGATGIYQISELVMQLRGEAGKCQIENARVGLAENLGGVGSSCSVAILRRL